VAFRYVPPGLWSGAAVSALSLAALAALLAWQRRAAPA
jgi:hypothetical protein